MAQRSLWPDLFGWIDEPCKTNTTDESKSEEKKAMHSYQSRRIRREWNVIWPLWMAGVAAATLLGAPPKVVPNTFVIDYQGKTSARISLNVGATSANDVTLAAPITPYSASAFDLSGPKIAQLNRTTVLEIEPGTANAERIAVYNLVNGRADQIFRGYNSTGAGKTHPAGSTVRPVAHELRVCYKTAGQDWDDQRSFENWSNGGNYPTDFIGSYLTGLDAGTNYQLRLRVRPRRNNLQVAQVSIHNRVATVTLPTVHGIPVGARPWLSSLFGGAVGTLVGAHSVTAVPTPTTYQFSTDMPDQVMDTPGLFSQTDSYGSCGGDPRLDPDLLELSTYPDGAKAGQALTFATSPAADVQPALPSREVDTRMPSAYAAVLTVPADNCGDSTRGLQALLNQVAAQAGSADRNYRIVIPRGTVCQGYFALRRKMNQTGQPENGTGIGWVVIEPDTDASLLPPPGVRTSKSFADAGLLARLQNTFVGDQGVTVTADDYANGYRLNNLDLGFDTSQDPLAINQYNTVVFLRGSDDSSREGDRLPRRIVLDRCLIGGSWYNTHGTRSAVRMRGASQGVINSLLHNCNNYPNMDTGCVQISDGQGPFLIENNEISGGSETIFVDDQAAVTQRNGKATDEFIPKNITIRRNHVFKPLEYFRKSDVYYSQTVLPVTGAKQVSGGVEITTAVPHDVGDPRNGPSRVYVGGGTGNASALTGDWPAERVDARTIKIGVPLSSAIPFGGKMQLTAGVLGANSQAVTWKVMNGVGTISGDGLYTAPTGSGKPLAALIQAISTTDASGCAFYLIQVGNSATVLETVITPILPTGQQFQFSLARPQAVTWGTIPATDLIDAQGLFRAPAAPSRRPFIVQAVSQSNPNDIAYGLAIVDARQDFAPIRIFAGNRPEWITDGFGQVWMSDRYVSGGIVEGPFDLTYLNTPSPELYRSYHQGYDFFYNFTIPNGAYTVIVKGQEPFIGKAGDRVFAIEINGKTVEPALDRFARDGLRFVKDLSYPATVTNGQLKVRFLAQAGQASLNGIEVIAGPEPCRVYIKTNTKAVPFDFTGQAVTVQYARAFQEKNLLELKKGRQVLVEGNLFENAWGSADNTSSGQGGHAIVVTPRGASGGGNGQFPSLAVACLESLCNGDVQDLTFRKNMIRNAAAGFIFGGFDYAAPSGGMKRAKVENNLLYGLDNEYWHENGHGTGTVFTAQNGVESVNFQHNTVLAANSSRFGYAAGANADIYFDNNIVPFGQIGINNEANGQSIIGWANRPVCIGGDWPCAQPVRGMLQGGGNVQGQKGSFRKNALYPNSYFLPEADSAGFSWLRSYWSARFYGDDSLLTNQYWISQRSVDAAGGICGAIGFEDCTQGDYRLKTTSPFRASAPSTGDWQNGNSGPATDGGPVGVVSHEELESALGTVQNVMVQPKPMEAAFRFTAPDAVGCPVDVSRDPLFKSLTRQPGVTGTRQRSVSVPGLTPNTKYYWRILCAAMQPSGSFTTPSR